MKNKNNIRAPEFVVKTIHAHDKTIEKPARTARNGHIVKIDISQTPKPQSHFSKPQSLIHNNHKIPSCMAVA